MPSWDCCPPDLISAGDLAVTQSLIGSALSGSALIERPTLSADLLGGRTSSWATIAAAVPCRIVPSRSTGTEEVEAARDTGRITASIEFPPGTDVGRADRVTVDGRRYEVLAVEPSVLEVVRRVNVAEVS